MCIVEAFVTESELHSRRRYVETNESTKTAPKKRKIKATTMQKLSSINKYAAALRNEAGIKQAYIVGLKNTEDRSHP